MTSPDNSQTKSKEDKIELYKHLSNLADQMKQSMTGFSGTTINDIHHRISLLEDMLSRLAGEIMVDIRKIPLDELPQYKKMVGSIAFSDGRGQRSLTRHNVNCVFLGVPNSNHVENDDTEHILFSLIYLNKGKWEPLTIPRKKIQWFHIIPDKGQSTITIENQ